MTRKLQAIILTLVMLLGTCMGGASAFESATAGTYQGTGEGFGGDITLSVEVTDSAIVAIDVVAQNETEAIGGAALTKLIEAALAANGAGVDAVAGATLTSNGFNKALTAALNEGMGITVEVSTETTLKDGTYTATAPSLIDYEGLAAVGEMTLEATFSGNQIVDIAVPAYTDTAIIGGMAFDKLAEEVIAGQSTDLDVVSGATVSQRAFMTALDDCIAQAGGDPEAFKARKVEKRQAEALSYDADIVVVGAGMAGLSAAIEAADGGANVIICEKQEVFGSSTSRSLGFVMGAGTDLQKAEGIDDTVEAFYEDIFSLYDGDANLDTDLLRKLCYESTDLYRFLLDNNAQFNHLERVSDKGARATKRIHRSEGGGSGLIAALSNSAVEKGATLMMGTGVTELIVGDDGAIIGVKATNKYGDDITINAQATVVAAGSYTQNAALLAELNPLVDNIEVLTGCGDGSAYYLFKQAGADIVDVDYIQMMYYFYGASWGNSFPESIPGSPTVPNYDVILVDGAGKRVASEDDFCFEYVKQVWNGGYNEGYAIYGQQTADLYPNMTNLGLTTKTVRGLPFGYKADTVQELADAVGMDAQTVQATIDRYNELCTLGEDQDFGKNPANLIPVEAPYYILRLPQICTDGYTGARINEQAQVISEGGAPIDGLYAAGSCASAQMTSINYNGCGTSLLTCGVYGRAAAQDAVSKLK